MKVYIDFHFIGHSESGITRIWNVKPKESESILGQIKWFTNWRKYCFFPNEGTIFEQDCLRLIAQFCEDSTIYHKTSKD